VASMFIQIPMLRFFWTASRSELAVDSVAVRAAQLGRLSGIFNQPLESGMAYSLGAFLLVYWVHHERRFSLASILIGALVLVGGLLSVSKVFFAGGLPGAALLLLWLERHRLHRALAWGAGALAATVGVISYSNWQGASRLASHFRPDANGQTWLEHSTAGRLGRGGTLRPVLEQVLESSPLLGFGPAGVTSAYDSAYIEMLAIGGLVGLGLFLFVLTCLGVSAARLPSGPMKALAVALVMFIIVAGLGAPTLTMNRAGVLLVVVVATVLGGGGRQASSRGKPRTAWGIAFLR
jgi:hypothetical protein